MNRILAWDPGASGAFAWPREPSMLWDAGTRQWKGVGLDYCRIGSFKTFEEMMWFVNQVVARAELVLYESQTGYAGIATAANTMFTFGRSFGQVEGAIRMKIDLLRRNELPFPRFVGVRPQIWQGQLGLEKQKKERRPEAKKGMNDVEVAMARMQGKKVDSRNAAIRTEWKRTLCTEAKRLYPDCPFRITLDNCDALLLLHYAHTHIKR